MMDYRVQLLTNINKDATILEGEYFVDALLGVIEKNTNPVAVYSKKKVIDILEKKFNFSEKQAYDFFYDKILPVTGGINDPVFITLFDEIVNIDDVPTSLEQEK